MDQLQQTIPLILKHLFNILSDITLQDFRKLAARIEALSYPPSDLVDPTNL